MLNLAPPLVLKRRKEWKGKALRIYVCKIRYIYLPFKRRNVDLSEKLDTINMRYFWSYKSSSNATSVDLLLAIHPTSCPNVPSYNWLLSPLQSPFSFSINSKCCFTSMAYDSILFSQFHLFSLLKYFSKQKSFSKRNSLASS